MAAQAAAAWRVDGPPMLVSHRENAVFSVRLPDGARAALRVHRVGYHSAQALRAELAWMSGLRAAGLSVPAAIPTAEGEPLVCVGDAPHGVLVSCVSWMEGEPLGQSGVPLDLDRDTAKTVFTHLGETIARMHVLSAAWTPPPEIERHRWDHDSFLGPQPRWGDYFRPPGIGETDRATIRRARDRASEWLRTVSTGPNAFGLIHADIIRENVLRTDSGVSIIDFDDCGFGWFLYDLAVALYPNRTERLYGTMRDALLEGYASHRSLSARDIEALDLFTALRALALIGWSATRAGVPGLAAVPRVATALDVLAGFVADPSNNI